MPPSYEKASTSVEEAEQQLRSFLTRYKDSPFRKKAEELLALGRQAPGRTQWYVARYYWDRGKWMGTVLRLRRLLDRVPGVGYDVDALWLLGRAYVKVEMPERARETWTELVTKHATTGARPPRPGTRSRACPRAAPPK
ncbi:MAG: outer membrane protein assembly factor BamD [Kofleriaceae bacterium]|nr:outer membrane protein assembly factor BamD [Kofleriaceae bacterium]